MPEPWHYTTFVDLFDHWQALIAGGLGFLAAIIVVVLTLRIEHRKLQREMDALQKSLAIELRQSMGNALTAGKALTDLATGGPPITARMVESLGYVPAPIVYPASANRIGLLGPNAMDVVIFYSLLQFARAATMRLIQSRTPDQISPATVVATAGAFLTACTYGQPLLSKLTTGVAAHDLKDAEVIAKIEEVVGAYNPLKPPTR